MDLAPELAPRNEADEQNDFVVVKSVSRTYKTKSTDVCALIDVSLFIKRGERIALLGRSGSGKSTLLNLLAGLDRPTSGEIHVNGKKTTDLTSNQMAAYRRDQVGIVFQAFNLLPTKSAVENVELPFVFAGSRAIDRRQKATSALASVGLLDRATHHPSELSGGEQQRVAIARSLVNQPALLLADEPTGNLDSTTANEILKLLIEYSEANQTAMLLVTHDEGLANQFAHRTIKLADGRIAE